MEKAIMDNDGKNGTGKNGTLHLGSSGRNANNISQSQIAEPPAL